MSNEEWFSEIESDLVLLYELHGVEKDGVKDIAVRAITSNEALSRIINWYKR
ncbi:MAG TPA: hypothetical protein VFM18_23220 [Methanosarcina sp.]|nr:hypothetical protein [Methanosarcina sp.]